MHSASRAAKSGSVAIRMPLVLSMTWRILRRLRGGDDREQLRVQGRLAAADLQQVGLAFAGDQRVEHRARPSASGNWPGSAGDEPAKQVGQVRLQVSLISISARQLCCSWSGQSPQS